MTPVTGLAGEFEFCTPYQTCNAGVVPKRSTLHQARKQAAASDDLL
jgi:hypothetical protein